MTWFSLSSRDREGGHEGGAWAKVRNVCTMVEIKVLTLFYIKQKTYFLLDLTLSYQFVQSGFLISVKVFVSCISVDMYWWYLVYLIRQP